MIFVNTNLIYSFLHKFIFHTFNFIFPSCVVSNSTWTLYIIQIWAWIDDTFENNAGLVGNYADLFTEQFL